MMITIEHNDEVLENPTETTTPLDTKPREVTSRNWVTSPSPDVQIGNYSVLREWQREMLIKHSADKNLIINSPCGAGKSFAIKAAVAKQLIDDPNKVCIILVPQTVIAPSFDKTSIELPDGRKVEFNCTNLCTKNVSKQKAIKGLFYDTRDNRGLGKRVLITTQQCFTLFVKNNENFDCIKNAIFVIDEAHHLQIHENGENTPDEVNAIGKIVRHILDNQEETNNSVILASATLFRGNRLDILTAEQYQKFGIFKYPLDEWLPCMSHLKSFSESFHIVADIVHGIPDLINTDNRTVIFIPHTSSKYIRDTGKRNCVKAIIEKIANGRRITEAENGTIIIGDNEHIILDMVDEKQRKNKKRFLQTINENRNILHTIIAMKTCNEGFDWRYADNGLVIGEKSSLTERTQMIGRFFRDVKGKSQFNILNILPIGFALKDQESIRQHLNAVFVAMLGSMLFVDMMSPPPLKREKNEDGTERETTEKKPRLIELFGDENDFKDAIEQARNIMLEVFENQKIDGKQEKDIDGSAFDNFAKKFQKVLEDYGIEETTDVAERVWKSFTEHTLQNMGIDASKVNFDIVKTINPLFGFMSFASDVCGSITLSDLRKVLENSAELNKEKLRQMAKNGEDRPKSRTPLGRALLRYTNKSQKNTYDEKLHKELIETAPKWFQNNSADSKKEQLRQMAKDGKDKPKRETPLGMALLRYTNKSQKNTYDEKLHKELIETAPKWFENSADSKKEKLRQMAKNGEDRPKSRTPLGRALFNYTTKNSGCYNEKLHKELIETAPKWFQNNSADSKKEQLLQMAKDGKERPHWKKPLGMALINYTTKARKGTYDEDFDEKIRELAPKWFKERTKNTYPGIRQNKSSKKWVASYWVNKQRVYIGTFETEELALEARRKYIQHEG